MRKHIKTGKSVSAGKLQWYKWNKALQRAATGQIKY